MKQTDEEHMKKFKTHLFYAAALGVAGVLLSIFGVVFDAQVPLRITFLSIGRHMNILALGGFVCTLIGIGFWIAAFRQRRAMEK